MSDSDWEVLTAEDERDVSPSLPPPHHSAASAPHTSASRDVRHRVSRQAVLTPLCLTLNQTGTRVGVGHTRGFVVFRVVAAAADATASAATAGVVSGEATATAPPAQSQLRLDPQYNMDLLTFSHIRERMQTSQQQRGPAGDAPVSEPHTATESAPQHGTTTTTTTVPGDGIHTVSSSEDGDEDDLGSFLTTASRVCARMRRDGSTVHPRGGRAVPDAAPSFSSRYTLSSRPVLDWGTDEDIDVDPHEEGDEPEVVAQRDGCDVSAAQDEEGKEKDGFVEYDGGGVAVMAFLYEQTWVALVGGGPTPMGPPNAVLFVCHGERQHQLRMPDPVVRLLLDARLMFVLTTAELRLYTNPMEPEWTCLRQSIALSASVARRYATVLPLAADAPPARVWAAPSPASDAAAAAAEGLHMAASSASSTKFSSSHSGDYTGASSRAVALPIIPVAVDYARSLVLLPHGKEGMGFAMYRYYSSPETRYIDAADHVDAPHPATTEAPTTTTEGGGEGEGEGGRRASAHGAGATAPAGVPTGRTTACLYHIATQRNAHRNPLYNLALYVGWPSSITRLLAPDDDARMADSVDDPHSGGGSGGLVTLVAASSEYATRLTLWMLQSRSQLAWQGANRRSVPYEAESFVLLREFRVGVRLAAPRAVVASLPGVSRYLARSHAALGGTKAAPPSSSRATRQTSTPSASASGPHLSSTSSPPTSAPPTSTVSSWAAEAAAAVASTATGPAAVQHLQFVGNGAYLLCIHGADTVSVFSTSARESEQEARNVCRDRVAAEQNRYSRLSIMKGYLPTSLSSRLDAYTRQAWSSCSTRLPANDPTFQPRCIGAVVSAGTGPPPPPSAVAPGAGADARPEGRRFLQRFTSLVVGRPQPPPTPSPSLPGQADRVASVTGDAPASHVRSSAAAALAGPAQPPLPQETDRGAVWGTPLTRLRQCIQVWSPAPHAAATAPHASGRPPIVLNCATCEGALVNIVLHTEEGVLVTSAALPYSTS
ncbi:hypothetical protein NESM_000355600 [Novymonas esmeraldas]|uniref:Uncharacterized protein n=1 Tax=Novymonas esmeraldas TaxID=1808958 RepID=A0AAW0EL55_9TRYP